MFIIDKLDLNKFMNDTNGDMEIIACKFLNRDCRHSWASVKTIYGTCLVFNPLSEHWKTMKQKSLFGRQSSISFSVKYNITDWTAGWTHYIEGCTIFASPNFEETLDPDDSIILTPGGLPILSVRQKVVSLLGEPYGECRKRNQKIILKDSEPLKFFEEYTVKHCQMECLIKEIKKKCRCNAPFFPYLARIDSLNSCNFTQHSFCVSNQIVAHDNMECSAACKRECDSQNFVHGNLQYAELDLKSPDHRIFNSSQTGISSMLLYQADTILMEKESPEYTRFEFMSDIGGTAGLILGVSLASMISMVERIVKKMLRKIIRLTEKNKIKRNPNHLSAL
ncbi:unnamed protein product [Oikopleura dioica]|uniref:Uncharacterized protein n=1 Tax=Oikopleura dioica TaxID=34765 RepID=E4WZE1_OIKDI|nr:unnamed protein product [Oikopleura dioica]